MCAGEISGVTVDPTASHRHSHTSISLSEGTIMDNVNKNEPPTWTWYNRMIQFTWGIEHGINEGRIVEVVDELRRLRAALTAMREQFQPE